jgi:hypothetical protein
MKSIEFEILQESLQSKQTFKSLRGSIFARYNSAKLGEDAYTVVINSRRELSFQLIALFKSNMLSGENFEVGNERCFVPYTIDIKCHHDKNRGIVYTKFRMESYMTENSTYCSCELSIEDSDGLLIEDILDTISHEVDDNFHDLNDEEKAYRLLEGQVVLGEELIRETKVLHSIISDMLERLNKRRKRLFIAEIFMGHWLETAKYGTDTKKGLWMTLGAALANGAITYTLVQVYFAIIAFIVAW